VATTDPVHKLWEALVTIANTNAMITVKTGRATQNLVPWRDIGTPPQPGLVGQLVTAPEIGGVGENYSVVWRFSAFAQGDGALRMARELADLWGRAVTQPALAALGVDAAPMRRRRDGDQPLDPEETRALARQDVTIDFWLTA